MKSKNGFTLVEVIVVSVIMAVLAIVAVPMYNNYVKSAKVSGAQTTCELISAAYIHQHNKGLDISANTSDADNWINQMGMANPADKNWTFGYEAWAAGTSINGTNEFITATSTSLGTYKLFFNRSGNNRWVKQ
jgi:prepilin-type N-terminal cleavage/methylation domain-containing protein